MIDLFSLELQTEATFCLLFGTTDLYLYFMSYRE